MTKFHVNAKGEPGVCKALVSCPFGDLEADHYDSKEGARKAYEAFAQQHLDAKRAKYEALVDEGFAAASEKVLRRADDDHDVTLARLSDTDRELVHREHHILKESAKRAYLKFADRMQLDPEEMEELYPLEESDVADFIEYSRQAQTLMAKVILLARSKNYPVTSVANSEPSLNAQADIYGRLYFNYGNEQSYPIIKSSNPKLKDAYEGYVPAPDRYTVRVVTDTQSGF